MSSTLYFVIALLLPILVFGQASNLIASLVRCGANEVYTTGSACVETCTFKPQICILLAKIACFCRTGFVRESDAVGSPCIIREACKTPPKVPICGENQEYTTCGSSCPPTCNDLRFPLPKPPKLCLALCKIGCHCKPGFYLSDDGVCVAPDQCCGENEKYLTCGSACPPICNTQPTFCTKQCVAGCFCACKDYVRQDNSTNSPCIRNDQCPEACEDDA